MLLLRNPASRWAGLGFLTCRGQLGTCKRKRFTASIVFPRLAACQGWEEKVRGEKREAVAGQGLPFFCNSHIALPIDAAASASGHDLPPSSSPSALSAGHNLGALPCISPPVAAPELPGVASQPVGAMRKQLGAVRDPAGAVREQTGVVCQAAGVVCKQTGAMRQPAGVKPDQTGAIRKPLGAATEPAGAASNPLGVMPKSSGAATKLLGATSEPIGANRKPLGVKRSMIAANTKSAACECQPLPPTPLLPANPPARIIVKGERHVTLGFPRSSPCLASAQVGERPPLPESMSSFFTWVRRVCPEPFRHLAPAREDSTQWEYGAE